MGVSMSASGMCEDKYSHWFDQIFFSAKIAAEKAWLLTL